LTVFTTVTWATYYIARIKDEAKVWFVGLEVVVVSCAHKCQSFWNAPILLVLWPLSFPQATVLQTSQFESTHNLDQDTGETFKI
jgi:hypothetical protein